MKYYKAIHTTANKKVQVNMKDLKCTLQVREIKILVAQAFYHTS